MNKPKLTIELVPSTCWFENVRNNVTRKEWDSIRKAVYKRADYKCEICGGKGEQWPVEAHEVWHFDDVKYVQKLAGIQALCPSCHEVKHIGLAEVKGNYDKAVKHLAKINDWDIVETEEYIQAVTEVWYARSRHEWSLDITILNTTLANIRAQERKVIADEIDTLFDDLV